MAQAATETAPKKSRAAYFREYRKRKRAERARDEAESMAKAVQEPSWEGPVDLAATIAWIEDTLKVPNGPLAGRPFRVEGWQAEWLHEVFADGVREAGMSVARKNGKSGFIAAVLLAGLLGPMNRRDWRGVVTSMTGFLAAEQRDAILSTAKASNLYDRIALYKAPPPGRIIGRRGARLDFLAADKATGHAIGCDLALLDEAGLMQENQRAL